MRKSTNNYPLPPGPTSYQIFSPTFRQNYLKTCHETWQGFGDLYRLKIVPGFDQYMAVHPHWIEKILTQTETVYRKPDLANKPLSLVIGQGLVTSEGPVWKRQRRLMQPTFHPKAIEALGETMARLSQAQVREWEQLPPNTILNITEEMQQLTLKIVAEALFSTDLGEDTQGFSSAFRQSALFIDHRINSMVKLPLWVPTSHHQKFKQARAQLNRVAFQVIQKRRQSPPPSIPKDLLDLMMVSRFEDNQQPMTDLELKDQIMTLLVAGHETVSVTLSWAIHLISIHPEIKQTLFDELERVLSGHPPRGEHAMKLPVTRQIIEEALRLYPPVWGIPRESKEETELGGFRIPKGTFIIATAYLTHRHPDFWEAPEVFNPRRFEPLEVEKRHKYAYFPFGGGPRICIGNQFALMEATLILAALFQRFDLQPVSEQPVEIDPTFTLRPKGGLWLKWVNRKG